MLYTVTQWAGKKNPKSALHMGNPHLPESTPIDRFSLCWSRRCFQTAELTDTDTHTHTQRERERERERERARCICINIAMRPKYVTLSLRIEQVGVKACSQHMNWTDLQQVDPVARRVHWSRASMSRLYFVLIGCSETEPVMVWHGMVNVDLYSAIIKSLMR